MENSKKDSNLKEEFDSAIVDAHLANAALELNKAVSYLLEHHKSFEFFVIKEEIDNYSIYCNFWKQSTHSEYC